MKVPKLLTHINSPPCQLNLQRCYSVQGGSGSSRMRAVQLVEYHKKASDAIKVNTIVRPFVGGSDVLIKVHAASINPLDAWMCRGYGHTAFDKVRSLPVTLGRDCSGVVTAIGNRVWNYKVGDEVFVATHPVGPGCQADFVAVPEAYVAKKPKTVSHIEAASLPFAALTAWEALVERAKVKPGQSVLVMGASGGVGTFAVQYLKQIGCTVSATCGLRNVDRMKSLGVDFVYAYDVDKQNDAASKQESSDQNYDVILDCVGGEQRNEAVYKLNQGGHLVTVRGDTIKLMDERGLIMGSLSSFVQLASEKLVHQSGLGVSYDWVLVRPNGTKLARVAELVDRGFIKPFVDDKKFELEQAQQAYDYYESGQFHGKVVINVN